MNQRVASFAAAVLLFAATGLPAEARGPASLLGAPSVHVVGNGDPASCTQATLFAALDLAGSITFNCGAAPKTIFFNTARTITATASLNGGDLINLIGNNITRLLFVYRGF